MQNDGRGNTCNYPTDTCDYWSHPELAPRNPDRNSLNIQTLNQFDLIVASGESQLTPFTMADLQCSVRKNDVAETPVHFYFDMTLTILRCDQVDVAFNTTSANSIEIVRGETAYIALSPKAGSYPEGCSTDKYTFRIEQLEAAGEGDGGSGTISNNVLTI